MTRKTPSEDKAAREAEKTRRLAEALRANLARRKARGRARAAEAGGGATPAPGNGPGTEED